VDGDAGHGSRRAAARGPRVAVQEGENLSQIAVRFNTTVDEILVANPEIVDPNVLHVGQYVVVPLIDEAWHAYTVQSGDTLGFLAHRFDTTLDVLLRANPQVADPDFIFAGQQPLMPAMPEERAVHTVQLGETLTVVAEAFNTSAEELAAMNPMVDPDMILAGQQLIVPFDRETWGIYTVQPNDILVRIASAHGTSVEALVAVNPRDR
jgi:LysM repeat protein